MTIGSAVGAAMHHPAVQAGGLLAGAAAVASFSPSLMPRPDMDQALVTGGSILMGAGAGVAAHHASGALTRAANALGAGTSAARIAGPLALAAIGGGAMLAARPRDDESLSRAAVRTAGTVALIGAGTVAAVGAMRGASGALAARMPAGRFTAPAMIGAAVLGAGGAALAHNLQDSREAHGADTTMPGAAKTLGIGLGIAGVLGGVVALERAGAGTIGRRLATRLPGPTRTWSIAGHALLFGGLGALGWIGGNKAIGALNGANAKVEPSYATPPGSPTVSGSTRSHVDFEHIGRQGRRFVSEMTPAGRITEVTGHAAVDPVRVYVGIDNAATPEARVALAMQELERTGAFDRSMLIMASPSGTGFVNPVPIASAELMSRGDVATVAMQYGSRPSFMSADRVANGAEQNTLLLNAINERMQQIDPAARPKLVLFGESLGAHTSQDVFLHRGTDGLAELGVDRALWTGTPYRSKWSRQVTAPEGRPDTDPRAVGVFNSIEDFEALPKPARDDVKAVMLTHDNDPVGHFGIDMLLQRPGWLGTDRPASVPAEMSWMPGVSFMQSLLDAKNAATVIPGEFKANGHDYRADLAPFVREAWGFDDVGDAELDRIVDSLVQDELTRSVRLGD